MPDTVQTSETSRESTCGSIRRPHRTHRISPATKPLSGAHSPMNRNPSVSLEICILYAVLFLLCFSGIFKPSAKSASSRNLLLSGGSTLGSSQPLGRVFCLRLKDGAIHRSPLRKAFLPFLA